TKEGAEALQKQLATELGTDKAATSCAQLTRLPGLLNQKYTPGCEVTCEWAARVSPVDAPAFTAAHAEPPRPRPASSRADTLERARRYIAAIPRAVQGLHGDRATFQVCCRLARGF